MPPRTHLTTAPGQEPSDASGRAATEPRERYVPGLATPVEPRVPSRWRRPLLALAMLAVVVAAVVLLVRSTTAASAEDPALSDPTAPAPGGG